MSATCCMVVGGAQLRIHTKCYRASIGITIRASTQRIGKNFTVVRLEWDRGRGRGFFAIRPAEPRSLSFVCDHTMDVSTGDSFQVIFVGDL